jgi:predicted DNA-binding transcriptional regulator YafY
MSAATVSELEARTDWEDHPGRRGMQAAKLGRIEDYLFIGGDRLSAARAARRLGVSPRTVVRYRAALRELAGVS